MTVIDPIADPGRSGAAAAAVGTRPLSRDFAMLAHDIRGALQGVIGGVVALERMTPPEEVAEQVERVSAASRSLDHLVGLLLGEAAEDQQSSSREEGLRAFADYLLQRWSGEARENGLEFEIEIAPGTPDRLCVDRMALARTVGNLLRNAITHGGGKVRFSASGGAAGGVILEVRDGGAGLPDDVREKLEDDAPVPSATGSHGLGLRIVRTICAEIGARLTLDNPAGGGLLATIEIPPGRLTADRPELPPDRPHVDPDGELDTLGLRGARVLLAEDNPTNQMVAKQMLRALDAEVTISSDGVEALEAFERAEYDLVVVDIEMPRMSGLDVIRAIRGRSDARADVPIVALTAYALREHRDRIAEAGANGLISKPITSIEALGKSLAAHLRPKSAEQPGSLGDAVLEDASDDPVVDMAVYRALCEAIGADMMTELLDKVIGDLEETRRELAGAIEPLDLGPIRSVSHILISVAGAIGANRLQHGARDLNKAAHSDDEDTAGRAQALLEEIDAAIDFARVERAGS